MKCICNFRYARARQGGAHFPDVKGLLRYLQYRDDRDDHIPGAGGPNRWIDGGLGSHHREILARLDQLSPGNRSAYCFSVVISPDPEALADVEGDPYERFVETIRDTMEEWEDWRLEHDPSPQAGPIEYSFVVHRPACPERSRGERHYGEQMHAHLILPAATEHRATRDMTPLYNNRPHVDAFKEITYRELDRVFDRDLERDEPELEREQEPELEQERELELQPEREPDLPEREIEFYSFFDR